MAKVLTERKDGRYRCRYKGKEFYGRSQTEALKARENYIDLLKAGLKAESEGLTVRKYSGTWLPVHKAGVKRNTYNAYASYIDRMNDVIGEKAIMHIVPTDIKAVYNQFIGKSDSTIHKVKFLITSLFDSAVGDGYIRTNPCAEVTPHKGTSGTHRAITDEERQIILDTKAKFRLPVMVMLYAGLRRGEVLALTDKDIDFKNHIIHVTEAISFEHNQRVEGAPKTKAGIREVPLFSRLEAELKGHKGYIAGRELTETGFVRAWEGYINTIERSLNGCQKRWYGRRAEDKAQNPERYARITALERESEKLIAFGKVEEGKKKKAEAESLRLEGWQSFTVRPHDLRHSFVTMLCDAKVEIDLAMKWVGHSDERMIRQIYDHITDYRTERAKQDVEMVIAEQ